MISVDLNADMGESFGLWNLGNDAELLKIVTSANIACGGHAGDPDVMERTMALASENGVGIGAHPGFADIAGFGRFRMHLPRGTMQNMIRYQVAAHLGMARAFGHPVRHLKLHGALSNMCSEDPVMAQACYEAALSVDPDLIIMAMTCTAHEEAVKSLGCKWAGEIFADRAYNDDGTLVDRTLQGAVIHDAALAGPRIAQMVRERAIVTTSGKRIPAQIDTICVHGDTPEALDIARAVRTALETDGATVTQFSGHT